MRQELILPLTICCSSSLVAAIWADVLARSVTAVALGKAADTSPMDINFLLSLPFFLLLLLSAGASSSVVSTTEAEVDLSSRCPRPPPPDRPPPAAAAAAAVAAAALPTKRFSNLAEERICQKRG